MGELSGGPSKASRLVQGELIAIDQNAVHILTVAGLQSVPPGSVRRVRLVGYGTPAGESVIRLTDSSSACESAVKGLDVRAQGTTVA